MFALLKKEITSHVYLLKSQVIHNSDIVHEVISDSLIILIYVLFYFFNNKLSVNLTFTDIFDTRQFSVTNESSNFYQEFDRKRESRQKAS